MSFPFLTHTFPFIFHSKESIVLIVVREWLWAAENFLKCSAMASLRWRPASDATHINRRKIPPAPSHTGSLRFQPIQIFFLASFLFGTILIPPTLYLSGFATRECRHIRLAMTSQLNVKLIKRHETHNIGMCIRTHYTCIASYLLKLIFSLAKILNATTFVKDIYVLNQNDMMGQILSKFIDLMRTTYAFWKNSKIFTPRKEKALCQTKLCLINDYYAEQHNNDIYIYIYIYISSSCRAGSTDIPDPLSPLLPIVHCPR